MPGFFKAAIAAFLDAAVAVLPTTVPLRPCRPFFAAHPTPPAPINNAYCAISAPIDNKLSFITCSPTNRASSTGTPCAIASFIA